MVKFKKFIKLNSRNFNLSRLSSELNEKCIQSNLGNKSALKSSAESTATTEPPNSLEKEIQIEERKTQPEDFVPEFTDLQRKQLDEQLRNVIFISNK